MGHYTRGFGEVVLPAEMCFERFSDVLKRFLKGISGGNAAGNVGDSNAVTGFIMMNNNGVRMLISNPNRLV